MDLGFQKADDELSRKLIEILEKRIDRLEIGIPDVFEGVSEYNDKAARFWRAYMGIHRGELIRLIDLDRIYLNTNMTRFWSGYKEKKE